MNIIMLLVAAVIFLQPLPGPAVAAQAQGPDDLFLEARFAMLDRDYDTAYKLAMRAHELAPADGRYVLLAGRALSEGGHRERAAELYQGLLTQDPAVYGYLSFELGYLYTGMGKYDQALEWFRRAEAQDEQRALLEQAYVYLRLGRCDEALAVLKQLPSPNGETNYLCARACFDQRDYDQAGHYLAEALTKPLSPQAAAGINTMRESLATARWNDRRARIYLTLMPQYDDNVFRDPLGANPYAAPPSQRSDFSLLTRLDAEYQFMQGRFDTLALSAGVMNNGYHRLTEANFASFGMGGYWSHQGDGWSFRLPYRYDHYYYTADYEPRLISHSIAPSVSMQATRNLRLEFYGLLQRRLYITDDPDVTQLGGNAAAMYFFGSPFKYLRGNIRVDHDYSGRSDDDYTTYEFTLGGGHPIWGPFTVDVGLSYVRFDFADADNYWMPLPSGGFERFERNDNQWRVAVQVICRPNPAIQLILGYYYTNNDSNLDVGNGFDPYKFEQNKVSLLFAYSF